MEGQASDPGIEKKVAPTLWDTRGLIRGCLYLSDDIWLSGYYPIIYTLPENNEPRIIKWPLDPKRVYEAVPIRDIYWVFLRASAFMADKIPEQEGETHEAETES